MHLSLTFASFVLLTAGMVLLRFIWHCLSSKIQRLIVILACAALSLLALSVVTKWTVYPLRLNAVLAWCAVGGYEFFIILFTRLRPKLLTSAIAVILIVPLLSASFFLPLARLFDVTPHKTVFLGESIVSVRAPWGMGTGDTSGADLDIYWRPSWIPFLQRRVLGARYFNSQCDARASFAVLQPDHKSVLMNCPAAPNQQSSTARSLVVKFH
jgi:hypothetical protein